MSDTAAGKQHSLDARRICLFSSKSFKVYNTLAYSLLPQCVYYGVSMRVYMRVRMSIYTLK